MKKLFVFLALALPMFAFAAERSVSDAAALAAQFMNQQVNAPARRAHMNASSMKLSHTRQKLNQQAPAFYVFNAGEGFVVVSGDDRTEDVLMYSDEGTLDVENANPNLQFWLNRLQEEISAANDENTFSAEEKKARKATTVTAIGPLLKNKNGKGIAWDQAAPYYNQCPIDQRDSTRCLTGCVATATAQIMYKWCYPKYCTGSHSYTWYDCMNDQCTKYKEITLSKDFSTVTFDWANMLPSYNGIRIHPTEAQKNAVATLMYCCGIACDMAYGGDSTGGSGAWTDRMAVGLSTYFGYKYDRFITMYSKSAYGTAATPASKTMYGVNYSDIKSYFNADLEAGRPIIMGGEDSKNGGHEFVCDGRDSQGNFHINWGWEGACNCYCAITSLNPKDTEYKFSSNLDALIGLEPIVPDTINLTNSSVRLVDLIENKQLYQFHGSSDDGKYLAYIAAQNVSSIVGKVNSSNLYGDYTLLCRINGTDTTVISYSTFLGGEVTKKNDTYYGDFDFKLNDTTFYVFHFEYRNPMFDPTKVDTIDYYGDVDFRYWNYFDNYGYKLFVVSASDGDKYVYQGYFVRDSTILSDSTKLAGTYSQDDINSQTVYIYDAGNFNEAFEIYSSSIAFKRNPDATYTMTGTVLCYGDQTFILNVITRPVGPPDQFTLTVTANNSAYGTVTGAGTYDYGTQVTLTATAEEGYKFDQWDDDNTDNPRSVMVTEDVTLTAIFVAATGLNETSSPSGENRAEVSKVIINGQLYILRDGKMYNSQGIERVSRECR